MRTVFYLFLFLFISSIIFLTALKNVFAQSTCQGTYICRLDQSVCSSGCTVTSPFCTNVGECPNGGTGNPLPGTCCNQLVNQMTLDCSGLTVTGGSCNTTSIPTCLNNGYVSSLNCSVSDPCNGGPRSFVLLGEGVIVVGIIWNA